MTKKIKNKNKATAVCPTGKAKHLTNFPYSWIERCPEVLEISPHKACCAPSNSEAKGGGTCLASQHVKHVIDTHAVKCQQRAGESGGGKKHLCLGWAVNTAHLPESEL